MSALLRVLADGAFHSGEELGCLLGVSRSAVWKQLQRLEVESGLRIHAVRGKGYRLEEPLSLLEAEAYFRAQLDWPVKVLDSIDSTNLEALRYMNSVAEVAPLCILAEQQTAGRGRRGRPWVSPYAQNLYLSLVLPVTGGARQLEGLSLTVGLAVYRALQTYGPPGLGLKWPNDLLAGGRKLAGILLELHGDPADRCGVVIGIGINVNMMRAPDVDQAWTSLRLASGRLLCRSEVVLRVCASLKDHLARHAEGGFAALREEWQAAHLWQDREVLLTTGQQAIGGRVRGVDASGALLLERDGVLNAYSGGELSLRLADDP